MTPHRIWGVLLILVGIAAIRARKSLTEFFNATHPLSRRLLEAAVPRLSVIWGIGVIIAGLLLLFG